MSEQATADQAVSKLQDARSKILGQMQKVIVGQDEVIDDLMIVLMARGHLLIEGVPGLAKTLMIRTLSDVLGLQFKRIQFTPDLMPSDITGTEIVEEEAGTGRRQFKFVQGPVFANLVLADEINRTPPKTQAALLEAMQERQVTVGTNTYDLPKPFLVMATQNPLEQEGTYPLPEAQVDRFMFKTIITYPDRKQTATIVRQTTASEEPSADNVLSAEEILEAQSIVRDVIVADYVLDYVCDLVARTRPADESASEMVKKYVDWGGSPRAAQFLTLGAKARAVMKGNFSASCDDVRAIARQVLRHRVALNYAAEAEGITIETVLDDLIQQVPEPKE